MSVVFIEVLNLRAAAMAVAVGLANFCCFCSSCNVGSIPSCMPQVRSGRPSSTCNRYFSCRPWRLFRYCPVALRFPGGFGCFYISHGQPGARVEGLKARILLPPTTSASPRVSLGNLGMACAEVAAGQLPPGELRASSEEPASWRASFSSTDCGMSLVSSFGSSWVGSPDL